MSNGALILNPAKLKAAIPCGRFTAMLRSLLSVPLLLALSGCLWPRPIKPMPRPPANLVQPCPRLMSPPVPLVDPARAQWEVDVVYAYADCAAKHRALAEAWPKS